MLVPYRPKPAKLIYPPPNVAAPPVVFGFGAPSAPVLMVSEKPAPAAAAASAAACCPDNCTPWLANVGGAGGGGGGGGGDGVPPNKCDMNDIAAVLFRLALCRR